MFFSKRQLTLSLLVLTGFTLIGCSNKIESEAKYPSGLDRSSTGEDIYGERETIFGGDGLSILGGDKKGKTSGEGITVNKFLWRAALDTISFMPLSSVDPFGGVILTDWYSPPETQKERFKLNVFILDGNLRSDGVTVKLFSQRKKGNQWVENSVSNETARKLEDTILTRARQLRVSQISLEE